MGNTSSCCKNNSCYKNDLYDMNMRLYNRHNKIHCNNKNLLKKQWFVLSENNFHTVYDEDVAKAMLYGST
jgi:hypothetical protein